MTFLSVAIWLAGYLTLQCDNPSSRFLLLHLGFKRRFHCFLDNCWQEGKTPGFHCLAPVFESLWWLDTCLVCLRLSLIAFGWNRTL